MAKLLLVVVSLGMAVADGYTQLNYGDPDKQQTFEYVRSFFPEKYTVKEDVIPYHFS